jgi:hypothetical protein
LDTLLGTNGQRKSINKAKNKNNVINAEGGILSQSSDGITANNKFAQLIKNFIIFT